MAGGRLGRRVHRQRLHHPLPHAVLGRPCATRTCAASGAPTARARKRRPPWRARCASARRARSRRSRRWWPRPRSTASGSAAPTTRASRTWSGSWTPLGPGREARRHRLREAARRATRRRRGAWSSWSRRPGCCTATSRTSSSRPASSAGARSSGRAGAALTGRPYLARAAEEHSGPHMPWFWQGDLQGGGVLNDMMCHSVEVGRHLLTAPGAPRAQLRPDQGLGADRVPQVVAAGVRRAAAGRRWAPEVDYRKAPVRGLRARHHPVRGRGRAQRVIGEVTTSWSFVGAGLRLSVELLGPEYSMSVNSLDTGTKRLLQPAAARARRARTWSRSRTPSRA